MHENREISSTPWSDGQGRSAKAINRNGGRVRAGEVGLCRSTCEPAEQGRATFCGGWGGKGTDEGEHRSITHAPDTEREAHVPGIGRCAESSKGKKAGTGHRLAPPSERRSSPRQLLRISAKASPGIDGVAWQEYETGLEIYSSIYTAGFTAERIGQNHQDESLYRRLTESNDRWASRRWRTRLFNRLW